VLGLRCTHGGGERRVSPTQRDVRIVTAGAICGVQHSPTERTLTTLRRNDRREQGTTARWMSDGGTGTHLGPAMCQMQARPAGCPARVSVVQHSAPRALRRARPHTTHRCTHIMQHPPAVAAECACPTLSTGRRRLNATQAHALTRHPGSALAASRSCAAPPPLACRVALGAPRSGRRAAPPTVFAAGRPCRRPCTTVCVRPATPSCFTTSCASRRLAKPKARRCGWFQAVGFRVCKTRW
jgi:hypothetical protein